MADTVSTDLTHCTFNAIRFLYSGKFDESMIDSSGWVGRRACDWSIPFTKNDFWVANAIYICSNRESQLSVSCPECSVYLDMALESASNRLPAKTPV